MKQAHLYKRKWSRSTRTLLLSAAVSAGLITAFLFALRTTETRRASEQEAQLETAIRRACVTCYAVEGRYPRDLDYITENYGVLIDTDAYAVLYDAFAENLMPGITVIRRGEVGG